MTLNALSTLGWHFFNLPSSFKLQEVYRAPSPISPLPETRLLRIAHFTEKIFKFIFELLLFCPIFFNMTMLRYACECGNLIK